MWLYRLVYGSITIPGSNLPRDNIIVISLSEKTIALAMNYRYDFMANNMLRLSDH